MKVCDRGFGPWYKPLQRCSAVFGFLQSNRLSRKLSLRVQMTLEDKDKDEKSYFKLDEVIWRGSEVDSLLPGSLPQRLSAPWRMALLSDGSVTRHLQLLTGFPVVVDCIEMKSIGLMNTKELPTEGIDTKTGFQAVRRQVFLRLSGPVSTPYVYATSWWEEDIVDNYLRNKEQPIWVSLSSEKTELYRDIVELQYGHSTTLERYFSCEGPFWARTYMFWHNGKPLTIIYEIFSPKLEEFLGPADI